MFQLPPNWQTEVNKICGLSIGLSTVVIVTTFLKVISVETHSIPKTLKRRNGFWWCAHQSTTIFHITLDGLSITKTRLCDKPRPFHSPTDSLFVLPHPLQDCIDTFVQSALGKMTSTWHRFYNTCPWNVECGTVSCRSLCYVADSIQHSASHRGWSWGWRNLINPA